MTSPVVGIDKLTLISRDYKLSSDHNFTVMQSHYKDKELNLIYRYSNGKEIRGSKMHCNDTELAKYAIIPNMGLKIEFNPNKIIHNYKNANLSRLPETLKMIEKEAADNGLPVVSLSTSTLSRVDLCRQSEMDGIFQSYLPIFMSLNASRKLTRDYGTTYSMGNKSNELTFYDKGAEIFDKHNQIIPESNLMRCEARWKNAKAIKSSLPFNTIETLLKHDDDDLHAIHRAYVTKHFSKKPKAIQLSMYNNLHASITIMKEFFNSGNRDWLIQYLSTFIDIEAAIENEFGSYSSYLLALENIGMSRYQFMREKKKMEKYIQLFSKKSNSGIDTLFNEFYLKFAS